VVEVDLFFVNEGEEPVFKVHIVFVFGLRLRAHLRALSE
jgi:hypothetical protein